MKASPWSGPVGRRPAGAMATQVRIDNPPFTHQLFSLYLGLILWDGLWLRDERLRAVCPFE